MVHMNVIIFHWKMSFFYLGVIPDDDIGYEIISIFNKNTRPFRKYQRMMYWMPKFKYANPYYIPHILPTDSIELAKMALKRMAVDLENAISVFYVSLDLLHNFP